MVVAKPSPMGSAMGDSNWNLFFYEVSQCHFCVSIFRVHNIITISFQAGRVVRSVLKGKCIIYTKFCLFQIKKIPSRIHSSIEGDSF